MAVVTLYRLAEEVHRLLEGGDPAVAARTTHNELKIACAQVVNTLIKADYLSVNTKLGEAVPNGGVLGTYTATPVPYGNGRSKVTLPIKPLKLPRGMGVFQVFRTLDPYNEFIPLQMGQANLLRSQPVINDLLGQIGYENFGMDIVLTQDLLTLYQKPSECEVTLRLVVLDASQLDDFDPLPVPSEFEWTIKQEVYKLYSTAPIPDKLVDSSQKSNKGVPPNQQKQA